MKYTININCKVIGGAMGLLFIIGIIWGGAVAYRVLWPENASYSSGNWPGATLLVLRSQIERFKEEHSGYLPALDENWTIMTGKSGSVMWGIAPAERRELGPYLQFAPVNPWNHFTAVSSKIGPKVGWVYQVKGNNYMLSAVNKEGTGFVTQEELDRGQR